MDGNGRWAQSRGQPRTFGHSKGAEPARMATKECHRLGVEALTLYTFSTENWQRPGEEVGFLMKLLLRYLREETQEIIDNNIRFRAVGFTETLAPEIRAEIDRLTKATGKNTGMFLNIALSYGSRQEITAAVKDIARAVKAGVCDPEKISEDTISRHLFTRESPDPDLLIRTGGDQRISNYLLWQLAYAELYFTDVCWPEFTKEELHKAIREFGERERRFGRVMNAGAAGEPVYG
ncbi:MAG: isoprenyl transferase [Bdellovibrionales bacterium]|nr:isoprenyl transferase [Bdellovibrionales bacterium]